MNGIRAFAAAAVMLAGSLACGVAVAQTSSPSTAAQVETWTTKQWEAAKKKWVKDKTKWSNCQTQSSRQKLEGRKNWSFLYTCMTG
ncbi:MAG: hypothetical protein HYX37_18320 [Rhizobiales bacterium]|nr:hypothetical protein [Hyphomicrobiales bacterium]